MPQVEGVWLTGPGKQDAHVYQQGDKIVIGHNQYDRSMRFTSPCLILSNDAVRLQYAVNGDNTKFENLRNVDLPPGLVQRRLQELLEEFLEFAELMALPVRIGGTLPPEAPPKIDEQTAESDLAAGAAPC